jgi:hypothetical protein
MQAFAQQSKPDLKYPVFVVGAKSSPVRMSFLWSPTCPDSARVFADVYPGLARDGYLNGGKVQLAVVSYARVEVDLMLANLFNCVPQQKYGQFVAGDIFELGKRFGVQADTSKDCLRVANLRA